MWLSPSCTAYFRMPQTQLPPPKVGCAASLSQLPSTLVSYKLVLITHYLHPLVHYCPDSQYSLFLIFRSWLPFSHLWFCGDYSTWVHRPSIPFTHTSRIDSQLLTGYTRRITSVVSGPLAVFEGGRRRPRGTIPVKVLGGMAVVAFLRSP